MLLNLPFLYPSVILRRESFLLKALSKKADKLFIKSLTNTKLNLDKNKNRNYLKMLFNLSIKNEDKKSNLALFKYAVKKCSQMDKNYDLLTYLMIQGIKHNNFFMTHYLKIIKHSSINLKCRSSLSYSWNYSKRKRDKEFKKFNEDKNIIIGLLKKNLTNENIVNIIKIEKLFSENEPTNQYLSLVKQLIINKDYKGYDYLCQLQRDSYGRKYNNILSSRMIGTGTDIAFKNGDINFFNNVLESNIEEINNVWSYRQKLHYAMKKEHLEIFEKLIEKEKDFKKFIEEENEESNHTFWHLYPNDSKIEYIEKILNKVKHIFIMDVPFFNNNEKEIYSAVITKTLAESISTKRFDVIELIKKETIFDYVSTEEIKSIFKKYHLYSSVNIILIFEKLIDCFKSPIVKEELTEYLEKMKLKRNLKRF